MVTLSIVLSLLGIGGYLRPTGLDYRRLMVFCLVWGMGGVVHLAADVALHRQEGHGRAAGRRPDRPRRARLAVPHGAAAHPAGAACRCPRSGIYESPEVNAFATGPSKRRSLVAVSTRPAALDAPRRGGGRARARGRAHPERRHGHDDADPGRGQRVRDVLLAHHRQHRPADGRREDLRTWWSSSTTIVLDIAFGVLGMMVVAWFSRAREFRADAGGGHAGRQGAT